MAIFSSQGGNWMLLLAVVVLLFNVVRGAQTGRVILFYGAVKRSEDPALYWFAMGLSGGLGIAAILVMIF